MISAVIIAKNEEKNLSRCLKSLSWSDEIIVIDDYSVDRTREIARKYRARVFFRHLDGDYARQRNYGLKKAAGEWVLFVDADEVVSKELAAEIKEKITCPARRENGFYLKRKDWFGGRWLNHGENGRVELLRLGKKGHGKWQRKVHEIWQISGRRGKLKNPILHFPHQTIGEFISKLNDYSSLHAQVLYEQGRKVGLLEICLFPLGKFFQNYFLRRGFLDGTAGLIMAICMSFHSFLARAKLYLLWKK